MKGIGYWSVVSLAGWLATSAGCAMQEGSEEIEEGVSSAATEASRAMHRPLSVAMFDHEPSAAEREEARADFLARWNAEHGDGEVDGELDALLAIHYPGNWSPAPSGYKMVELQAKTSDINNAGTDGERLVRFTATWLGRDAAGNGLTSYERGFVLDYPSRNDLHRGQTAIFYYLVDVPFPQDQFWYGQLTSTSSDAWHCASVTLHESNAFGSTRSNSEFPVQAWIDTTRASGLFFATNSSWQSYR